MAENETRGRSNALFQAIIDFLQLILCAPSVARC